MPPPLPAASKPPIGKCGEGGAITGDSPLPAASCPLSLSTRRGGNKNMPPITPRTPPKWAIQLYLVVGQWVALHPTSHFRPSPSSPRWTSATIDKELVPATPQASAGAVS